MLHRLTKYSCIYMYKARMSPTLNGSSMIRHFEHSDAIEIHDGIIFDFYPGLSHIHAYLFEDFLLALCKSHVAALSVFYIKIVESHEYNYLFGGVSVSSASLLLSGSRVS